MFGIKKNMIRTGIHICKDDGVQELVKRWDVSLSNMEAIC
jgi:hypothetical protein